VVAPPNRRASTVVFPLEGMKFIPCSSQIKNRKNKHEWVRDWEREERERIWEMTNLWRKKNIYYLSIRTPQNTPCAPLVLGEVDFWQNWALGLGLSSRAFSPLIHSTLFNSNYNNHVPFMNSKSEMTR
jgi:hypothetical protein